MESAYKRVKRFDRKWSCENQKMKKKEYNSKLAEKEQSNNWQYLFPEMAPKKKTNSDKVHPKNKLNDLTGKEWIQFSKSWILFNALASDLKEERAVTKETAAHPATFSPTMISEFIRFFTKKGQTVLDPFAGIGSTLVACDRTGRRGIGIELNPKYAKIAKMRTKQEVVIGDARNISRMNLPLIDYSITSPPYWNVLHRSTGDFKKRREKNHYDTKYSDNKVDLGNIDDYNQFIKEIFQIYKQIYSILKDKGYITVIIKNVKKEGKLYPLAWDLAEKLGELYILKDEKIWIQDKVRLAPYGYPYGWVSNIIHHYCLILQKDENKNKRLIKS
jgi:DNA modification methylase